MYIQKIKQEKIVQTKMGKFLQIVNINYKFLLYKGDINF